MVYESRIPVGLWECLCSTGMTVKQISECHTLLTGKHTLAELDGRLPPCYVNHLLCSITAMLYQAEHSDRVGGLTVRPAQNF